MTTLWLSPLDDACQSCNHPFESVMYDARLPLGWGNYCHDCFAYFGGSLGTGKGQRYELKPYGDAKAWVKVAG